MVVSTQGFNGTKQGAQTYLPSTISALSASVLTSFNVAAVPTMKEVQMAPSIAKYLQFVDSCWDMIVSVNYDIEKNMGPGIFRHICALFFARRMEDITYKALGLKSSVPNRVLIPNGTKIFQPILDVLATIGTLKITETSTIYIPTHPLPDARTRKQVSQEYELEIRRGCAFDWESLARGAQEDLDRLAKLDSDHFKEMKSVFSGKGNSDNSEPDLASFDLASLYEEFDKIKRNLAKSEDEEPEITSISSIEEAIELIRKKEAGRDVLSPVHTVKELPINFGVSDPECGINLGWSEKAWKRYQRFVDNSNEKLVFGPGLPISCVGSPSWILDVNYGPSGYFVKMPLNKISPADVALSIIVPMSSWHIRDQNYSVENWHTSSSSMIETQTLRKVWIHSAIKSKQFGQ